MPSNKASDCLNPRNIRLVTHIKINFYFHWSINSFWVSICSPVVIDLCCISNLQNAPLSPQILREAGGFCQCKGNVFIWKFVISSPKVHFKVCVITIAVWFLWVDFDLKELFEQKSIVHNIDTKFELTDINNQLTANQ